MKIRRASANDLEEILQLFWDTVITVNAKDYHEEQLKVWSSARYNVESWKKKLHEQLFIVGEESDLIHGFASLEKDGCLDMLYIHKDHQHRGVATALVGYLEEKAREMQLDAVYSDVSITARPFFKSRGYAVVRENRKKVLGVEFVNAIMRKSI